jgi:hypothetical protein
MLDGSRGVLPLAAAVVRDTRGNLLAATERAHGLPVPARNLDGDALAAATAAGESLPPDGARLALVARGRQVGWLDVWGDGRRASADSRRVLADVGGILALIVAGPGERAAARTASGLPESEPRE